MDTAQTDLPPPTPNMSTMTHVTKLPKGFMVLRVLQFLFAIIVLSLTIRASLFRDGQGLGEDAALHVIIWIAAITGIILIWVITATYYAPKAYNYWAILAMEIFAIVMWIFGFICMIISSLIASRYVRDICNATFRLCGPGQKSYPIVTYVACALSAAILILYIISLTVVGISITRHRRAGGHNKIGSPPPKLGRETGLVPQVSELPSAGTGGKDVQISSRYA